jgi:hypothetical protein
MADSKDFAGSRHRLIPPDTAKPSLIASSTRSRPGVDAFTANL